MNKICGLYLSYEDVKKLREYWKNTTCVVEDETIDIFPEDEKLLTILQLCDTILRLYDEH